MKTIKNILAIIASVAVLACIYGCDEDKYLTTSSPDEVSINDFPKTFDQTTSLLTAAYAQIHHWDFMGSTFGSYAPYPLEYDIDWQHRSDADWPFIEARKNDGPTGRITSAWSPLNKGVHYCNVAIEGIDYYANGFAKENEQQTLKWYKGEAYFLRAYYWWHLMEIYAQPDKDGMGIPILERYAQTYADSQVERKTTGECYEALIKSLETASELLAGQTNKYRVSEWDAKAFLAKVYFFNADGDKSSESWKKSKALLEDIFKNSGKTLVSYKWLRNMFNGDSNYEHSSENFFEVENVKGGSPYIYNQTFKPGSEFSRWHTHTYLNDVGKRSSADNANVYCHSKNISRMGYTVPTYFNFVHQADVQPDASVGWIPFNASEYPGYYIETSYLENNKAMKERCFSGKPNADDPDPRFYINVMMPMLDSCKNNSGEWTLISPNIKSKSGNNRWYEEAIDGFDRYEDYTAPMRKYQYLDGNLNGTGNNCSGENIVFLRLAELYLIYAQICADEGDTKTALEYVNKVHRRAYNGNTSYDYKSLNDRTKTASASDHLANDVIKYELWIELFGEMKWIDYIRYYRIGPAEASYHDYVHGPGNEGITKCSFTDRDYAMPIPTSELMCDKNLKQTPGYSD